MSKKFECSTCGQLHADFPMAFSAAAPYSWYEIPEDERESRTVLTSDQCIIDERLFFVLARLLVPVNNEDEYFTWLVWVSLSSENFDRMDELWESPGRESEPPYFGWLNTALPGYPDTLNLKCQVITRPLGERPLIELEPTSHPLAVDQHEGIGWLRLRTIVESILHPTSSARLPSA